MPAPEDLIAKTLHAGQRHEMSEFSTTLHVYEWSPWSPLLAKQASKLSLTHLNRCTWPVIQGYQGKKSQQAAKYLEPSMFINEPQGP